MPIRKDDEVQIVRGTFKVQWEPEPCKFLLFWTMEQRLTL